MKRKIIFCTFALTSLLLSGCTHKNNEKAMISEEEAKRITLAHAELTTDQVTFIKSEVDRDNGNQYYDVEFYTKDQKEYDYKVDLYTGEILDVDYDVD